MVRKKLPLPEATPQLAVEDGWTAVHRHGSKFRVGWNAPKKIFPEAPRNFQQMRGQWKFKKGVIFKI
ncbi:hypothetical protein AMTR_s00023p00247050 [Amborella trichopoda]|uniref:Uncharacterized protein n=1 Tax=Amborella trichopoda TaxID=13333 RepID=W1NJY0_AMBTC|nr:hypothetical protein AMTR_s00023p00247050 [Amborella trichopoda]